MTTSPSIPLAAGRGRTLSPIFIIGVLFFIFGFVTWLNSTLILYLKVVCQLDTYFQAFFVTFVFYISYVFLALPSAVILKYTGFKNGMALGLVIMAAGSLLFLPAAHTRSFSLFLTGLFVQGMGLTLLQTAANPYITILGPIESAAKRISIMGICNKAAGIVGPLLLGAILLKNASGLETQIDQAGNAAQKDALLQALAGRVVPFYIVMAILLFLLSILIKASSLPETPEGRDRRSVDKEPDAHSQAGNRKAPGKAHRPGILQYPHLILGVLCIFFYVGIEVMAGDGIGAFGKALGMSLDTTRFFTSFTLGAMLVGYVIGIIVIPRYISQSLALRICAWTGLAFTVGVFLTHGYAAVACIALLGLSNSLMWPAIWPLALTGLGKYTKTGSALLIMGIAGGAIIPQLFAKLLGEISPYMAFSVCALPIYGYILFYAFRGHKVGLKTS